MDEGLRGPAVVGVEERDGTAVIRASGELDLYNADELRTALDGVRARSLERVVVDLSAVTFIDSTGLGVLVEARAKLGKPHALLLAAPAAEIRRALEVSGLDRHLPMYDSVDEALAAPS